MSSPPSDGMNRVFRERPVSVLITAENRPLASWLALGLAAHFDTTYFWTDVRAHDERPSPGGPLALGAIPDAQLSLVHPEALQPNEEEARLAGAAAATVVRAEGEQGSVRRLEQFLGLPTHTQELISATQPSTQIRFLVLANAERIVHYYPATLVGPTLEAILASGCSVILTFVGAPPQGRAAFDFVADVRGTELARWREVIVRCEKGSAGGLLSAGSSFGFADVPGLAALLERYRLGLTAEDARSGDARLGPSRT
jgi:hypothetical protein